MGRDREVGRPQDPGDAHGGVGSQGATLDQTNQQPDSAATTEALLARWLFGGPTSPATLDGIDLDDIDNQTLARLVLDAEQLRARLEVVQATAISEVEARRCINRRVHRSGRLWMASELRVSASTAGSRFNRANDLAGVLAPARQLLFEGKITTQHLTRLARLARDPNLVESFTEQLDRLLEWAQTEDWAGFSKMLDAWAEMNDRRDPADIDRMALDKRSMAWAQGLDGEVLVELSTTGLVWDQAVAAMEAIADRMFAEDWAAAQALHGDDTRTEHLARSRRQRRHDAFAELLRHGIANIAAGRAAGLPSFVVNVTVDRQTLIDEAARRDGEPMPSRPVDSAASYRCETANGLRLTPSTIFDTALAGRVRLITLELDGQNISISRTRRLFTGPLRQALMIRDRHCRHPGCDTPAHRCQADHKIPASHHGPTTPDNGQMLCAPCHRHKTGLEAQGLHPPVCEPAVLS